MKIKTNYFLLFGCLLLNKATLGMMQVRPSRDLQQRLQHFHTSTYSYETHAKPNLEHFKQPNRVLIAKLYSAVTSRYFLLKDNEQITILIQGMRNSAGRKLDWLCYDLQENEQIINDPDTQTLARVVFNKKIPKDNNNSYNVSFVLPVWIAANNEKKPYLIKEKKVIDFSKIKAHYQKNIMRFCCPFCQSL